MDTQRVQVALERLGPGLSKCQMLLQTLYRTDVSRDRDFQRKYNGFFRMQRRSPEFYDFYFSLLEKKKYKGSSFGEILDEIYRNTHRMEASFSSKMLSVIDPSYPVWDRYVLTNLGLKAPPSYAKDREEKVILLYEAIVDWYASYLKTEEAAGLIQKFDTMYPHANITDIKKLDLIIWQMR